jgi:hypothetical protein
VRSRFESAGRRRVTLPPAMDCQQTLFRHCCADIHTGSMLTARARS